VESAESGRNDLKETNMKLGRASVLGAATAAAAIGLSTPAHADVVAAFLSGDGKVACTLGQAGNGDGLAVCDVSSDNGFNAQLPMWCASGRLVSFVLEQGQRAGVQCRDGAVNRSLNVVSDQSRTAGLIDCENVSADSHTECSDRGSGHYFRIFADHYEMG
jgi:hypothetical protein